MLEHASAEVLVAQLPPDLVTRLIARALESGVMSPASVLETTPAAVLPATPFVEPPPILLKEKSRSPSPALKPPPPKIAPVVPRKARVEAPVDWNSTDEFDILDEKPLPPSPALRKA